MTDHKIALTTLAMLVFILVLIFIARLSGCTKIEHVPRSEYKMIERAYVMSAAELGFNAGYTAGLGGDDYGIKLHQWLNCQSDELAKWQGE